MVAIPKDLTCQVIYFGNPLDIISEEFHTDSPLTGAGGKDLQDIPPDSEGAAVKIHIIASILHLY